MCMSLFFCTFAAAKVFYGMSRNCFFIGLVVLTVCILTSCEPAEEPIAYWYPKKQLVEEFVSQYCGYCPGGMQAVHNYTHGDSSFIVISHHYGFQTDHFSAKGGGVISTDLKVNGTPSICINRDRTKYTNRQSAIVFSPSYLTSTKKDQFDDRAFGCVDIVNTYNASTRRLSVQVSGRVSPYLDSPLRLSVLIKESGMIDIQKDYSTTNGWKEYRHVDAVRVFLTDAAGEEVDITSHRFSAKYTYVLDDNWIPENCMVVAFISEGFQPIVNVDQQPVIKGSHGGSEFAPEGITLK